MTKADVLACLDDIGRRVVHADVPLGVALGVAYFLVQELPADAIEQLAAEFERAARAPRAT